VATTDKVYRNDNSGIRFKESDQLWGHDPYSFSKAATELVTSAWRNLADMSHCKVVSVRSGNVIGPGDLSRNRLVPDLLAGIASNSKVWIRNPTAVRPWQYVLDPLIGYLLVGVKVFLKEEINTAYNFGPTDDLVVSVADLVEMFLQIAPLDFALDSSTNHLEAEVLRLDSSLAYKDLGWKTKTNLQRALEYCISLSQSTLSPQSMMNHIKQYLSDV
jgi:CDP-glucose 4,6-dehydratase